MAHARVRIGASSRTLSTMGAIATPAADSFVIHDDPINQIAFAPHGDLIATADTALKVKIWRNREPAGELDFRSASDKVRPTERVRGIRFSRRGDRLYVAAGEQVAAFAVASLEPEWSFVAPRLFAFLIVSPISIAVSGQDVVAAAFDNGSIALWDAKGESLPRIRHNAAPRQIQFLPDDSILGADGFHWSLWRAGLRKPLWNRRSHERIYGMASSFDGALAALRHLYTTDVLAVATGEKVASFEQGRGLPLLAFVPGTHVLAIGTQHGIDLHNLDFGARRRLELDDAELVSMTLSPDGGLVVAGCSDGRIRIWDNPVA